MTLIQHQAIEALTQWKQTQLRESHSHNSKTSGYNPRWVPPPCGYLKCNVDAAVFSEGERYSYNFIIRNDQGSMVSAKNGCMRGSQDAFTTEAMSSREALTWQKVHGFTRLR